MRSVQLRVRVRAPGGSRRCARCRRRLQHQRDPRCDADPPQRLPSSQKTTCLGPNQEGMTLASYTDSVCRLCRREGSKLFLKGDRCYSEKCAYERRQYPPGQHGQGRHEVRATTAISFVRSRRSSACTALLEKQFRGYFQGRAHEGHHRRKPAGLARAPARQLVVPLGFALEPRRSPAAGSSRPFPSTVIEGQHPLVPRPRGRRDRRSVRERAGRCARDQRVSGQARRRGAPAVDRHRPRGYKGKVKNIPQRSDISHAIDEQLIVELYSK